MQTQAIVAIGRDIALTAIGLAGIVHQELIGPVKPELLIVYTALLGIPGATNLVALARGIPPTGTGTGQSVQAPPSSRSERS